MALLNVETIGNHVDSGELLACFSSETVGMNILDIDTLGYSSVGQFVELPSGYLDVLELFDTEMDENPQTRQRGSALPVVRYT